MVIVGDRIVLQKDVKGVKCGSVCTIAKEIDEKTLMVRFKERYIGVDKVDLRKAGMSEIKAVLTSDQIVDSRLWNGAVYMINAKVSMNTVGEGDIGFVMGVEVTENEEDDVFILDFGTEKLKLTKKFIYDNMSILTQMQDEFVEFMKENQDDVVLHEEELLKEDIYSENNNKNNQKENVEITSVRIDGFHFDLHEKGRIKSNVDIKVEEVEKYINALNNLKDFLK